MTDRNCSGVSRVEQVQVDDGPKLLGRLARRRDGRAHSRIVHQNVDAPEGIDSSSRERLAVVGVGDVGAHGDGLATCRFDERLGLGQPVFTPRTEYDVGAGLGQCLRKPDAEAARGTGDDRDAAIETEEIKD